MSGFHSEYLWELDAPQIEPLALAATVPNEEHGWRTAENARSFSAGLVHITAINFALMSLARGARLPPMTFMVPSRVIS
jgi:hypothetical protein